jgi:hypothetical protein
MKRETPRNPKTLTCFDSLQSYGVSNMTEIATHSLVQDKQLAAQITPPGSWRDALLAMLLFLWPLLFLAVPPLANLFFTFFPMIMLVLGLVALLTVLFVWAVRITDPDTFVADDIPLWTGTWLGFALVFSFLLVHFLVDIFLGGLLPAPQWATPTPHWASSPQPPAPLWNEAFVHVIILACLFGLLRWNQRIGLLATLPYIAAHAGWWWLFNAPQDTYTLARLAPVLNIITWLWLAVTAVAIVRLQKSEWAAWLIAALGLLLVAVPTIAEAMYQPGRWLTTTTWPDFLTALAPFLLILLLRPFWTLSQQDSAIARIGYYLLWAGLLLKMLVFTELLYLETPLSLTMRVGLGLDLIGLLALGYVAWSHGSLTLKIAYPFLALALLLAPLPYMMPHMVPLVEHLSVLSPTLLSGLGFAWLLLALLLSQVGWNL